MSYSIFTLVLKMITVMVVATVLWFLTMSEVARQTYHSFGASYFDSVILENSFQQGVEESGLFDEVFDTSGGEVYTAEG